MKNLVLFTLFWCFSLSALDRGSSAPLISGDTFRAYANHVFDETTRSFHPEKVKTGDVVFVKTDPDYLLKFFREFHPHIKHPYILLTHNSDHPIPGPFFHFLNDPKIIAWFGQNVEGYSHSKLISIPIGIANRCWEHGSPEIFLNKHCQKDLFNRDTLLYMNFSIITYRKERSHVYSLFRSQPYCQTSVSKKLDVYLDDVLRAKFVLSPRGNGVDCHRTWEALLMGAFPIVRTSLLDSMYEDLPVVIVEKWEDVDKEFLEKTYSKMCVKKYKWEKLYIYYWLELIQKYKKAYEN